MLDVLVNKSAVKVPSGAVIASVVIVPLPLNQ
jgi:hypothetical protein